MDPRTSVLGDCSPWGRDGIDVLRVVASGGRTTGWAPGNDDTDGDLVRDTLGSLAGAALLVVWARFGWGPVRRMPA